MRFLCIFLPAFTRLVRSATSVRGRLILFSAVRTIPGGLAFNQEFQSGAVSRDAARRGGDIDGNNSGVVRNQLSQTV